MSAPSITEAQPANKHGAAGGGLGWGLVEWLLPALPVRRLRSLSAACLLPVRCLHWLPGHVNGVQEWSKHQRLLPLPTPSHLPARKGLCLAHGTMAEGHAMSCLCRQRPGPSPGRRRRVLAGGKPPVMVSVCPWQWGRAAEPQPWPVAQGSALKAQVN